MEPHKQFFREFRALKLFVMGTMLLCMGLVGLKDAKIVNVKWLLLWLGFTSLFFMMSFLTWRRSRSKRHRHRQASDPEPIRMNPPAKLPPLRK